MGSEEDAAQVLDVFKKTDVNGDGKISRAELGSIFRSLGEWTDERIDEVFAKVDVDGDGFLQYKEFLNWVFGGDCDVSAENLTAAADVKPSLQLVQAIVSSLQGEGGSIIVDEALADALGVPAPEDGVIEKGALTDQLLEASTQPRLFFYWCMHRKQIKQAGNIAIGKQIQAESGYEWAGPGMMITGQGCDERKWISTESEEAHEIILKFQSPATVSEFFVVWGQYSSPGDLVVSYSKGNDEGEQTIFDEGVLINEELQPAPAPKGLAVTFAAVEAPIENVHYLKLMAKSMAGGELAITDLVVHGTAPQAAEPEPVVECACADILEELRTAVPKEAFLEPSCFDEGAFQDAAVALSSKNVLLSDGVAAVDAINEKCAEAEGMFVDSDFPADETSVLGNGEGGLGDDARGDDAESAGPSCWRRIKDFAPEGKLFVGGIDMNDVMQGALGDCWLISVVASLACSPKHLKQLIYPQIVNPYGVYAVRMYSVPDDTWYWVVVDDKIPLGENGRPYFISAQDPNELWPMLVEKAFAKVNTAYAGLNPAVACGGTCAMSMLCGSRDVLSWAGKSFEGPDGEARDVDAVWDAIVAACDAGCSAACGVADEAWAKHTNAEMDSLGVVYNHVFSCVGYKALEDGTRLLWLRNPWGEGGEWTGPWSDSAPEWTAERRAEVPEFAEKNDATFFISLEDFYEYWFRLEICRLQPMVSLTDLAKGKVEEE